jgi:CheY-like chemotaxis protein
VHGFAHQSGGTVTIQSELGRGTIITLYLPRARDSIAQAEVDARVDVASGGSVLVVEDNPDVAEVTASMLAEVGYTVLPVAEASAALELIGQREFDLVVSDIVMPGAMDGLALARAIQERKPGLPVLLVTGYSKMAQETGSDFPVVRKPFDLAELSRVVTRLIAESQQPPDSNLVRLREVRRGGGQASD